MTRTVVHFTDAREFGGAERMLLTLLDGLDRTRWRPLLYHQDEPGVARLVQGAREAGVETRAVPTAKGRGGSARFGSLVRELRAERPAVFHAHLAWPLRCTRGLLAARLARVPAIVATQQLFAPVGSRARRWQHRLVSSGVHRYIAVSSDMARALRPICVRGARQITVIHNAVRPEAFDTPDGSTAAPPARNGADARVVLTLARLDPQKGLHHLLHAAASVPEATFIIAGEGSERARLEALARELGIAHRVHLPGHRDDVPQLIARCDLFVLPSLYEGLPVSLLEAMAAGKPVVATAVRGTDEVVVDDATGLLVPRANPAALAAAIRRVLADPCLAHRLGTAGRERARGDFSARRMVERVSALYDELLSSAGARYEA